MFKVRILGYNGLYPTNESPTSGYLVTAGKNSNESTNILIDCGSGVFSKLCDVIEPKKLNAIIITHTHFDHMSDIGVFNYYLQRENCRLKLYLPISSEFDIELENRLSNFDVERIGVNLEFNIDDVKVNLYKMEHPITTYGVAINYDNKRLAYSADTNKTDSLNTMLLGANLAIMDSAFLSAEWNDMLPHLSAKLCAEYAKKFNVELVLSHINPTIDKQKLLSEAKSIYEKVSLAELKEYYL